MPKLQPCPRNENGEPLTTDNMAAEMEGGGSLAVPAGLTHEEAVAFVRKYNQRRILQFVTFS